MKQEPTMQLMEITPDMAREWLAFNLENRPVKENTIARYVQAMQSGQWEPNGETIKFSDKGVLLDGQHRLRAVIQSGVTIKSFVVHDLPSKVFDTIDTGSNRSISDLLALQGQVNNSVMGPVLRLLYVQDQLGTVTAMDHRLARIITNRDLLETLDKHPNLPTSVSYISGVRGFNRIMSPPIGSFCHYQFAAIQPYHADAFFIKLVKGSDSMEDSPILALKERLENMRLYTSAGRVETIALTINAWNAYRLRKSVKSLRWSKAEDFPKAA